MYLHVVVAPLLLLALRARLTLLLCHKKKAENHKQECESATVEV